MFTVSYSDKAKEDIREIVLWYNSQKVGLESDFLSSLEVAIKRINVNPYTYQIYFRHIRAIILRRFPYRIIYKINDEIIIVIGVFHTSRNPKTIPKRTKE